MILFLTYFLIIVFLSLYSYSLLDPNITFFNHPMWTAFRNIMVDFGYNKRQDSWLTYLTIIILLFIFHYIFVLRYKKLSFRPFKIALVIGGILLFSYPFLSADFFSYIFYARIFTVYYRNPYTMIPGDFYLDPWLRFTQWTGHNFLYGPVYFLISIIPSFLGFAKFLPTFFLFKLVTVSFYLLAVWFFEKLNKKWAVIFATSPLILIEGLVNGHNDLIGVSLVIIGLYYLISSSSFWQSRFNRERPESKPDSGVPFDLLRSLRVPRMTAFIFILLSIGIKYLTFPFLLILPKLKNSKFLVLLSIFGLITFWTFKSEIQPWYFMILFGLLPFYENLIMKLNIFFFGLLMSYYPFVRWGGWGKVLYWTTEQKVDLKHKIILFFFAVNLIFVINRLFKKKVL